MIDTKTYHLRVFNTTDAFTYAAAEFIADKAIEAIEARGRFTICLSGGETPYAVYELLSGLPFREQIMWKKTHVFWGDERCVPLDDQRNNSHQARSILLNKVNIPSVNIHFMPVNLRHKEAAISYEKELNSFFGGEPAQFDLVLLGLGTNGHTASLFPYTNVLTEKNPGIRTVYVDDEQICRITMTAPLINEARHILFLVSGQKKASILKTVLTEAQQPDKYPAQLIKPRHGDLYWFTDKDAASLLDV